MLCGSTRVLIELVSVLGMKNGNVALLTGIDVTSAILLHGVGELGGEEDVLTLAGVLLEPLTEQILAVLIHVRSVPEEIALVVDLVEDREALRVGFRLAVEGTLAVEQDIVSDCKRKMCGWHLPRLEMSTCQLTNPIVPYPILLTCGPFLPSLAVGSLLLPVILLTASLTLSMVICRGG
jgi:hypothetical protein